MWHYTLDGQSFGPITEAELDSKVQSGSLPAETFVWRDGMAEWQPYNIARAAVATAPPAVRMGVPVGTAPVTETTTSGVQQGATRFESFSSWGTVAMLVVAMFVFLGVLANRPSIAAVPDFSEFEDDDDALEEVATPGNRSEEEPSAASVPFNGVQTLTADVKLRSGSLTIENKSTFDWPASKISFLHGNRFYSHEIAGLKRNESTTIPLTSFASFSGAKYRKGLTKEPTNFVLFIKGYGTVTTRLSMRQ